MEGFDKATTPALKQQRQALFSDRLRQPGRGDGRMAMYTAMADDATRSGKSREGAMLYSAAEKHLEKEEPDEAISSAADALKLFKALGAKGTAETADTTRLLIAAHRLKAELANKDPDEAVKLAEDELKAAKGGSDKYTTASMLLAVAENKVARKGGNKDKFDQALEHATEALKLIQELGDKKLESIANLVLAKTAIVLYTPEEATKYAEASVALCDELGDLSGKGKALHTVAVALMMTGKYTKGVDKAKEAASAFKSAEMPLMQAFELLMMGDFCGFADMSKKGLPYAEEGLALLETTACSKDWPAIGLFIVSELLIASGQTKSVLKRAKDELAKYTEAGLKKPQAIANQILAMAQVKSESSEKALSCIEAERAILEELGDKGWLAYIQHVEANIHLEQKENDEALEALDKAVELAQEADDAYQESMAHYAISDVKIMTGAFKDGLKAAQAARDLSQTAYDKYSEAMDCMQVALAQSGLDENSKALSAANEAQEIFQEIGDPRGEGFALSVIADLKMAEKKSDAALEAAEERLTLMRDLGDPKLEASALHQLAQLHMADENYTDGERCAKEARTLAQKTGDAAFEAMILITLIQAIAAQCQDKSDKNFKSTMEKAAKFAGEAVTVASKVEDKFLRGQALYWHAQMLAQTEKITDALRATQEAAGLFQKMEAQQAEATVLILQGGLQFGTAGREKALDTMDRALGLARASGDADAEYDAAMYIQKMQPVVAQPMMQQMMPIEGGDISQAVVQAAPVSVEPAKPKGLDAAFVRKQLMTFVKDVMATDDELELDSPFMEAGMDSLSSVSLMSMVAKEFQMALSPSLVFDFPTVRALEEHLVEESKNM